MSLRQRFGRTHLTEHESKQVFEEHGIPVAGGDLTQTEEEAVKLAEDLGFPVFLKLESEGIQHKTDVGGVKRADTPSEVREIFKHMEQVVEENSAQLEGVRVEEALEGSEFIAGIVKDPQFGHTLMFGFGGIYVEVFQDVSFRVLPVTDYDLETMVDNLRSRPLLEGVRGQEPADMGELKRVLNNLAQLVEQQPEIKEIDINPLFIQGNQIKAADALITLVEYDE